MGDNLIAGFQLLQISLFMVRTIAGTSWPVVSPSYLFLGRISLSTVVYGGQRSPAQCLMRELLIWNSEHTPLWTCKWVYQFLLCSSYTMIDSAISTWMELFIRFAAIMSLWQQSSTDFQSDRIILYIICHLNLLIFHHTLSMCSCKKYFVRECWTCKAHTILPSRLPLSVKNVRISGASSYSFEAQSIGNILYPSQTNKETRATKSLRAEV